MTDKIVCVICLDVIKQDILQLSGYSRIQEYCTKWAKLGIERCLNARIADLSFEIGMICHKKCYAYIVNKNELKRYEAELEVDESANQVNEVNY